MSLDLPTTRTRGEDPYKQIESVRNTLVIIKANSRYLANIGTEYSDIERRINNQIDALIDKEISKNKAQTDKALAKKNVVIKPDYESVQRVLKATKKIFLDNDIEAFDEVLLMDPKLSEDEKKFVNLKVFFRSINRDLEVDAIKYQEMLNLFKELKKTLKQSPEEEINKENQLPKEVNEKLEQYRKLRKEFNDSRHNGFIERFIGLRLKDKFVEMENNLQHKIKEIGDQILKLEEQIKQNSILLSIMKKLDDEFLLTRSDYNKIFKGQDIFEKRDEHEVNKLIGIVLGDRDKEILRLDDKKKEVQNILKNALLAKSNISLEATRKLRITQLREAQERLRIVEQLRVI